MIVVNSDHKKILNKSLKLNVKSVKRSKILSGDHVSDYSIISSTIENLKKKLNFDYVLYLQPTSPFRKIEDINRIIKKVIDEKLNGSWSVTKIDKKFHPYTILKYCNKELKLFSNKGKKIFARQQLGDLYIRNGVFYFLKIKALKNSKSIYLSKLDKFEIDYDLVNIDDMTDLNLARKIYPYFAKSNLL